MALVGVTVSVSCQANRPWHQKKSGNGKRHKHWLGRFRRREQAGDGLPLWESVQVARTRKYSPNGLLGQWAMEQALEREVARYEAEGWYISDTGDMYMTDDLSPDGEPDVTTLGVIGPDGDFYEQGVGSEAQQELEERGIIPAYWEDKAVTDATGPVDGSQGAYLVVHDDDPERRRYYRMKCPCGYQIKLIPADQLEQVLERMADGEMTEVSIQNLLNIVDRIN